VSDSMRQTAAMNLIDYFIGRRIVLRSPLSPGEAKARINDAAPLVLWPWSVGVSGRIVGHHLRLSYRAGLMDYNAKPVLAGRVEDNLGSTILRAKYRAPVFVYLFFPFWYGMLLLMAASLVAAYLGNSLEPEGWIGFPILCLFAVMPIGLHYLFNRNADDELEEIILFLEDEGGFSAVDPLGQS